MDSQQLLDEADALRDEAKSLERRVRLLKQMSAAHADHMVKFLESEEDTRHEQHRAA